MDEAERKYATDRVRIALSNGVQNFISAGTEYVGETQDALVSLRLNMYRLYQQQGLVLVTAAALMQSSTFFGAAGDMVPYDPNQQKSDENEEDKTKVIDFLRMALEKSPMTQGLTEKFGTDNIIYALLGLSAFAAYREDTPPVTQTELATTRKRPPMLFFLYDGTAVDATFDYAAFQFVAFGEEMSDLMTEEEVRQVYDGLIDAGILHKVYSTKGFTITDDQPVLILDPQINRDDPVVNPYYRSNPDLLFETDRVAIPRSMSVKLYKIFEAIEREDGLEEE
jgi:hypothetical protein